MLRKKIVLLLAVASLTACLLSSCGREGSKEEKIVNLNIWNYYNGEQLDAFNARVNEFNQTVGAKEGIFVESYSHGSIADLENNLLNSANEKAGADELPNIFSAYADTIYELDQMEKVADLSAYLTDEEYALYIENYLKEGDFYNDGSIKIFPIVKSTELLCLNQTDWEPFAAATGTTYEELATIEGVVSVAEKYYNWSGGKALFGRDAMANYMLIGAKQFGCTIFDVEDGKMTVNFDKKVVRKLWDNYYVPFIKGYFAASGRFRSDDIKTGNIIVYQGSSTSVSFFPAQAMISETESHDIQLKVLPAPKFKDGENVAVQQGAGMSVTKATEEEIEASVTFLKWFTQPENDIEFSIQSGYLPVTKAANNMKTIDSIGMDMTESMREILSVSMDIVNSNELYTTKAFLNGQSAREILDYALSDQAANDRSIVKERISQGMSPEEAQAEFLTEEAFESWYQKTLEDLKKYESK